MEFLLAPIVTVEQYGGGDAGNRVRIDGEVCVDFWYLHLQDRDFRSITAAVHEDETMPGLRALPCICSSRRSWSRNSRSCRSADSCLRRWCFWTWRSRAS